MPNPQSQIPLTQRTVTSSPYSMRFRFLALYGGETIEVSEDILNPHAYEIHLAFWRALQINEDYKD